MRQCDNCSRDEQFGEGREWLTYVLVTSPGPRGQGDDRDFSNATTVTPDWNLCPKCQRLPKFAGLHELVNADYTLTGPRDGGRCAMVCVERGPRLLRRLVTVSWIRSLFFTCPHCHGPARIVPWHEAGAALRALAGVRLGKRAGFREVERVPFSGFRALDEDTPVRLTYGPSAGRLG